MKPFAALGLGVLLFSSSPGRADVQNMTIAVNGVVCPVCAHSLNMGLRRVPGIKSVKVLMENRVNLSVTLQPGAWIEPTRLFQQISLVGYRARQNEVSLRLRGMVTLRDGRLVLTMTDVAPGPVTFLLAEPSNGDKHAEEIRLALESLKTSVPVAGQLVEVEGLWQAGGVKSDAPSLLLTRAPSLVPAHP